MWLAAPEAAEAEDEGIVEHAAVKISEQVLYPAGGGG
jgi:hypothetical protein